MYIYGSGQLYSYAAPHPYSDLLTSVPSQLFHPPNLVCALPTIVHSAPLRPVLNAILTFVPSQPLCPLLLPAPPNCSTLPTLCVPSQKSCPLPLGVLAFVPSRPSFSHNRLALFSSPPFQTLDPLNLHTL